MGVEETIKEIACELERIANTRTVVGEPITAAGKTIIPISRISMGFGAGGGKERRTTNPATEEEGAQARRLSQ